MIVVADATIARHGHHFSDARSGLDQRQRRSTEGNDGDCLKRINSSLEQERFEQKVAKVTKRVTCF
jgi:hypothetical protein